uniref:Sugar transporter SWEET1 n=1 Tax=Timema poppense TaxID=170557 RepID=A0A7R9GXM8_TIMPO|nr:unnamed protein product [Timema poppensis]
MKRQHRILSHFCSLVLTSSVSEMLAISCVDSIDIIVGRFFYPPFRPPTLPLKVKASRRLICPSVRRHVNGADRMNVIDDPIVDGSMESNTPCEPLNLVKHKTKPVAVVAPSAVLEAPPTFSEPSQGRLLKIPKAFSSVDSAKIGDPLRPDGLYSMIHSLVACEHKFLTTLYVNGLMNGSSRPPLGFPLLPGYSGSFLSDVYRGQFGVAPVLGNLLTFADTQRQLWQMVGSPENQLQSSAAQIPCASTSTDTELPLGKKSRGKRSSSMDQKNSTSSTTEGSKNQDSGQTGNNQDKKKPHIKKPLNAFMLYMKEMRAKVVAECTLKESAAINQILGRRYDMLDGQMIMALDSFKELLAVTASISTILQFLTGVLICQKFVQKGTTGETSGLSFVSAFLSCSLWLRYGFFIRDNSIILVNTFGASLQLAYVITYYLYCVKKSLVCRQMFAACTVLVVTLAYSEYETDLLVAKHRVGLLCCLVTIIFFAAPLTMLAHVIRVKSAETLPFSLILATFVVSAQWFLYGFLLDDFFIQVPNALGTALSGFQLSLFVIYRSDSSATSPLIQIR